MKVNIYKQNGEKSTQKLELKEEVFASKIYTSLMEQYIYIHNVNTRQGTRSTKGRGEVSGTGKKPWKNNKVGKARTGSMRTNIFRTGGVSHGPKPYEYNLVMPKKMRRKALYSSLSIKKNEDSLIFVDKLVFEKNKLTKQAVDFLEKLSLNNIKTLIITENKDENIINAFSNIKKVKVLGAPYINSYDILNYRKIIFLKDSVVSIPGYNEI